MYNTLAEINSQSNKYNGYHSSGHAFYSKYTFILTQSTLLFLVQPPHHLNFWFFGSSDPSLRNYLGGVGAGLGIKVYFE